MSTWRSVLALSLLHAGCAHALETVFYEDFQDGKSDGWEAFGSGPLTTTVYERNAALRMTGDAVAATWLTARGLKRVRIGASFAAAGLDGGEACIGEATFDDGQSWFEIVRVGDGHDDGVTLHADSVLRTVPDGTARIGFRARVAGESGNETCWLDNVFVVGLRPSAPDPVVDRHLTRAFLQGVEALAAPVAMREYAMPGNAAGARHRFSGKLRLHGSAAGYESRVDWYGREAEVGDDIRRLPEFDFEFVRRGNDIVPLQRGLLRRNHPYWEIIVQPGKAWHEADDGDWSRASVPFALQERSANCTHNGVLTWLFNDNSVSRVAYQVVSETCQYFQADLWGVVDAQYTPADLAAKAAPQIARLDAHRASRLPVRPLARLAADLPEVDPLTFAVDDGISPNDVSVLGLVVDGIHYRGNCDTRYGLHPYCDSLPLPSYSLAKSIFAGLAAMRLEKLKPGSSQVPIATIVEECRKRKWRNVTVEHALDMATGLNRSAQYMVDEDSAAHIDFIYADNHVDKVDFACSHFKRRFEPGAVFNYHTSDTYLVGVALRAQAAELFGAGTDVYDALLVEPLWRRLNLSPLLDDTKRTYDAIAQPFAGYGLTVEADDIVRIAGWLQRSAAAPESQALVDPAMLAAAMQRDSTDRGVDTGIPNLRYNNGFWAFDAGSLLGCGESAWIPFMSGVSGITVAMMPNGVIYYYFSDSGIFRWRSGIFAAHAIRGLCE